MLKKNEEDKKDTEPKKKKKGLWDKLFNKNRIIKKNKVAVIYLKTNGNAKLLEIETRNGFFNINGRTYHENRDCMYTVEKERYPLAMIREWDVTPIGRKSWEDKEMQEKHAILQDHVMKGIRHAERVRMGEKDQMKLNVKSILLWVIIGIIVVAVIMGYK